MRRKGVPCGCADDKGCCGLKEKLAVLWDRTIGSILRINGISPDGDGDFTIEAGSNIALTETGTGNGIRIDTTGGVSYYESGDAYVNVDNNDLEITVNAGSAGGLALQDDLDTVTGAVASILDGTTVVPEATNAVNATYLGSDTANVGSDTKPIKIVNGQAVAVTDDLTKKDDVFFKSGDSYTTGSSHIINGYIYDADSLWMQAILPKKADNVTIASVSVTSLQLATLSGKKILTSDITGVTSVLMSSHLLRLNITGNFNFANTLYDTPISGFFTYTITFN